MDVRYTNGAQLQLDVLNRIINREITTFEELVDFLSQVQADTAQRNAALSKGYRVIKILNWGVFAGLNQKEYPVLWKELVIPSKRFKTAGDLKRSMTISNLFISMLDIHGYTAFCRQSKKNLSKLHELDEFLNTTIQDVAKSNGCVGNRERGDEILLVGGKAIDIMRATFEIIQVFAKERFFRQGVDVDPTGEFNAILPPFHISAGISGGNINAPMIITRKGEISGFLLNTAARLQARANKLAPKTTLVIIAKTVHSAFEKEVQKTGSDEFTSSLDFFDCGSIQFKGMSIANLEVLYKEEDKTKLAGQDTLLELFSVLKQNLWGEKIFTTLVKLISVVIRNMPDFLLEVELPEYKRDQVNNESLRRRLNVLKNLFLLQEDYVSAVEKLQEMVMIIQQLPGFEPIVVEYAQEIVERYRQVIISFQPDLEREIEEQKKTIFSPQECKVFDYYMKNRRSLMWLVEKARQSPALTKKKMLWNTHIEKLKPNLDFSLYSGKK